ncbi:hypothetical protein Dimus_021269, partial [Dionaea muscipula]
VPWLPTRWSTWRWRSSATAATADQWRWRLRKSPALLLSPPSGGDEVGSSRWSAAYGWGFQRWCGNPGVGDGVVKLVGLWVSVER